MAPATTPAIFGRGTAIFREHADLRPMVARLRKHATQLAFDREPAELAFDALLDGFFTEASSLFVQVLAGMVVACGALLPLALPGAAIVAVVAVLRSRRRRLA